jgi:hypothetical protein
VSAETSHNERFGARLQQISSRGSPQYRSADLVRFLATMTDHGARPPAAIMGMPIIQFERGAYARAG